LPRPQGWIRSEDDLLYVTIAQTFKNRLDFKIVRADAIHGRYDAMQNVVKSSETVSTFQGKHIESFLDNTYTSVVAIGIKANVTWVGFRDVVADRAKHDLFLDGENGLGKGTGVVVGHTDEIVCEPLRRFGANARQLVELLDEAGNRRGRLNSISHHGLLPGKSCIEQSNRFCEKCSIL
jgi:hypothetical protein